MKRNLLILIYFLLRLLCPSTASAQPQTPQEATPDSIRISLLTCASGGEIYSLFGHTAIRYENFTRGIDAVFNYGMFNFNAPNFIFRFALGETDYQLGVTNYEHFASETPWTYTMAAKKEAAANEQQVTTQTTPAAEAEDIIAKAKAEAAAIVAEAQAKAKETLEAAKETAPAAPKPNDLVPIRLFKDNDKYKDDVFVAVNGRSLSVPVCQVLWKADFQTLFSLQSK